MIVVEEVSLKVYITQSLQRHPITLNVEKFRSIMFWFMLLLALLMKRLSSCLELIVHSSLVHPPSSLHLPCSTQLSLDDTHIPSQIFKFKDLWSLRASNVPRPEDGTLASPEADSLELSLVRGQKVRLLYSLLHTVLCMHT